MGETLGGDWESPIGATTWGRLQPRRGGNLTAWRAMFVLTFARQKKASEAKRAARRAGHVLSRRSCEK